MNSRSEVTALAQAVGREVGVTVDRAATSSVDDVPLGAGYGVPTAEAQAAIELLARTEGVVADPVYTGKGARRAARARPRRRVRGDEARRVPPHGRRARALRVAKTCVDCNDSLTDVAAKT